MTPAEARQIATRAGARLVSVVRMHDGEHAYEIRCPTHESKVRLLVLLAERDSRTPDVRRVAEIAVRGQRDALGQIAALHRFVREGVVFTREGRETFSPTMVTLRHGIGDCDDSAIALIALLRTLGFRAGALTLGNPPKHVAAAVYWDGRWHWLETTIAAEPGEHPIAAARRLGIRTRPDLA